MPPPRSPADDSALPPVTPAPSDVSGLSDLSELPHLYGLSGPPSPDIPSEQPAYDHRVLKSLLGAWALSACSIDETAAVEGHLSDCGTCAEEALRLRDAVGLLHPEDSLDLDPMLRSRVLQGCMVKRAPRVPVPEWAAPFDAETSRLDALLRDMADAEWLAPVLLRWFDGQQQTERETTVAGVIAHLLAVDGLVAATLGLPDPLDADGNGEGRGGSGVSGEHTATAGAVSAQGAVPAGPTARTEEFWRADSDVLRTPSARGHWRDQGHAMVRTASFAGQGVAELEVSYGGFALPVRDALLDRAFECWVHAEDIAEAIDYPYDAPQGAHMHHMVDLAARMLPGSIAWRRRRGLASPPQRLAPAGTPGRALHLEVEGDGGGDWYIPLDSPAASARPADTVAHVALDGYEFCQLAAGHVPPLEAAAGQDGDREAIRDVLFAAASLSRM
ncbi:MDMPI N domain containing protein [Streptomyces albidus (ex Kaewkla and Franco 2022)]|uniref:MDMPI N domain containing protein n=1 Tax=Streptomyces albidus (ex Kaewkla and Franco 2022) TaxID=722709 RepID=UPI0028149B27|nr:MDMPI N domain containing protein [Streptomyces albidus (ex Kaewkla and Franco 2022)]